MKMLFIHDNRFWKSGEEYYSYGHFAYDLLWKRYLRIFDEIEVGGRIEEAASEEILTQFSRSSGERVSFFGLPNLMSFSGLKQIGKAQKQIEDMMQGVDCTVIRIPSNLGYLACRVAERLHKRYILEVVGCTWDDLWNYGTTLGRIYAPVSFLLERKCVRRAKNVMYVSRHFLQKRYPNHNYHISCPDTNVETPEREVLERRLEKIRRKGPVRIGLIASLNVGYKGHDTAIFAMEEILRKHPNTTLAFLGDGDRTKWENMAKEHHVSEHVEFCGALPGGDPVLSWLDGIDIFIMPSLQETLGRALIEAMSRGCPAIGGAGTAVQEQLPNDCIHARKNYHELADMICYMIEHPNYMELCAVENYERSKKYSERILMERRDSFWEHVLNSREAE